MKKRGFEKISKEQFVEDFFNTYFDTNYEFINLPERGTACSAGYDVFAPAGFKLFPGDEIKIPTGIKAYMQNDEMLLAYPRSSLGFKYYCRLANTIGIIDADYYDNEDNEGHIWVKIRNESKKEMTIERGEAICQLIFQKYLLADGDSFDGEERTGGIGSTG